MTTRAPVTEHRINVDEQDTQRPGRGAHADGRATGTGPVAGPARPAAVTCAPRCRRRRPPPGGLRNAGPGRRGFLSVLGDGRPGGFPAGGHPGRLSRLDLGAPRCPADHQPIGELWRWGNRRGTSFLAVMRATTTAFWRRRRTP